MQNVNPHIEAENQIAVINSALAYLELAKHRLTDRLYGRVPSGRIEHSKVSVDQSIKSAIADLQKVSTARQSPS
jgi:hypothetical protein